ncbi:tetratricopeptide repeat protein [Leptospira wolffii]|uniref:tetratricopeptide repeat protein n=1 Tax=Leptospira wolffii TaxID=409998 RepID=UPI0002F19837|nr:tetratricopeptide repeat protein [Leptospira wolffii]EPG67973.1 tetratricopeptide repeat protein [Leptospira wolffii serovar Khorat str. Khorat-H2]TGL45308.1 tetratricopeptide repeat protein [Leptospira wolffii]
MAHSRSVFALILFLSFSSSIYSKDMIYAFRDVGMPKNTGSDGMPRKEKMVLIGETMLFDKVKPIEHDGKYKNLELGYDTRPDIVTVKVHYDPGIRPGQILYLIEKDFDHETFKDGSIVGQIEVKSVFQTAFIGKQLRGVGYLSIAKDKVLAVAFPVSSELTGPALVERKKGDYHFTRNEIPEAIQAYRKAIRMDPLSPMPHFRLGLLYLNEAGVESKEPSCSGILPMSAGAEFSSAWKKRARFEVNQDVLQFSRDYVSFLNCKSEQAPSFAKGSRIPEELERAQEVARLGFQILKTDYELLIRSAETYYKLYNSYSPSQKPKGSSPEEDSKSRNRQEKSWEIAQRLLKEASLDNLTDYRIHRLTALLYGKRYLELSNGSKSSTLSDEANFLRNKALESVQAYKLHRPKTVPGDKDLLILEKDL